MADGDDTPDDGRLDRRRIRAAVLDEQSAAREQRVPMVAGVVLACGALGFLMLFNDAAEARDWTAVVFFGAVVLVCAVASWRNYTNALRLVCRRRAKAGGADLPQPTDFTGLGGGETVDERMARIADEPDA